MKKYIIFGAGKRGKEILSHINNHKVAFFCDNNIDIINKYVCGIKVISPDLLKEIYYDYTVLISVEEKSFVRRQLEDMGINSYVVYASDEYKGYVSSTSNKNEETIKERIEYYVSECQKHNPVKDFDGFKMIVENIKKDKTFGAWIDNPGKSAETLTYGHFRALTEYSGINNVNPEIFPCIAHGVFFFEPYRDFKTATIFASPFYKKQLNDRYSYIPSFCVGPYIYYTKGISMDNANENVLVFLNHSIESEDIKYTIDKLNSSLFEELKKKYKKVFLCVYWIDIDKEIYLELRKQGIIIVSAGFRFDQNFIGRLRLMLDMVEDVVVCGRTTALIYALCLGKRLTYYSGIEDARITNDLYDRIDYNTSFQERLNLDWETVLLSNQGKRFNEYNENERNFIDSLFGINITRSPEFFRMVYEISEDIWKNCNYLENQYPIGVYKTYWDYQRNYDFDKLQLLSEALGKDFWNV